MVSSYILANFEIRLKIIYKIMFLYVTRSYKV